MKAWTLAQKDLLLYARDRTGLVLGVGLPLVLAVIFGTAMGAMGGGGGGTPRVSLAVEDRDGSEASRELVEELEQAAAVRVVRVALERADEDPEQSARGRVARGAQPAGLWIGQGYGAALAAGAEPPLVLYRDPSKDVEQQVLAGALVPVLAGALGASAGERLMARGLEAFGFPLAGRARAREVLEGTWRRLSAIAAAAHPAAGREERAAEPEVPERAAGDALEPEEPGGAAGEDEAEDGSGFAGASPAALLETLGLSTEDVVGGSDEAEARRLGQSAHAVAGIAVMMLLFGLVACGSTLRQEEEEGTLERLRLAGSDAAILGGKFAFTWIIGMAQLVVLFVFGTLVFRVPFFREPVALVALSAATAAAATGFGILFAATCQTRKQVEGVSTLVILAMSAAGGSWFPLFVTPDWFQTLGHFTLNAWAMDGFHGLFLYDRGLPGILPQIGVLCAIAAGTSGLAVLLWKRRLAR